MFHAAHCWQSLATLFALICISVLDSAQWGMLLSNSFSPTNLFSSSHPWGLKGNLWQGDSSLRTKETPNSCWREISSWPATVNITMEEKQQKKDIWDKLAFRDNIWDNWLPTNLPESTVGTGRLRDCYLYLTLKLLQWKVGFPAEMSKLCTEL